MWKWARARLFFSAKTILSTGPSKLNTNGEFIIIFAPWLKYPRHWYLLCPSCGQYNQYYWRWSASINASFRSKPSFNIEVTLHFVLHCIHFIDFVCFYIRKIKNKISALFQLTKICWFCHLKTLKSKNECEIVSGQTKQIRFVDGMQLSFQIM